ncbi:DUF998 domain-containing protein [Actinokineospora sp. G85]|uniref:DUF998 domain-containing protein n=1 Tax=Actinokineospora sp. G85 TaxID=3406626 RepID=UPI003C779768
MTTQTAQPTAGLLPMDPGDGFPVGTGAPTAMSWHSVGHMAAGSVSFLALVAACLVLARHFRRGGERRRGRVPGAGDRRDPGDGTALLGRGRGVTPIRFAYSHGLDHPVRLSVIGITPSRCRTRSARNSTEPAHGALRRDVFQYSEENRPFPQ